MTQSDPNTISEPPHALLEHNELGMGGLERRINDAGEALLAGLGRVIDQLPGGDAGPQRLAKELYDGARNEGKAINTREQTHRMAEANKAFAHFAW